MVAVLRVIDPPASAFITLARGELRAEHRDTAIQHRWVGLNDIAACMPLAAVASEDQTFPSNHGFAWSAIEKALRQNADGGNVRGASTLTQQTAKNLFLWPAKSYIRKGGEAYITLWIDLLWSKARTIEVYLNIAQFGPRVFGVSAAAHELFGTTAAKLSQSQCATLAAVLPAPTQHDAAHPDAWVAGRRQWILSQMRHLGRGYLNDVIPTN